jgi:hypothetical protein
MNTGIPRCLHEIDSDIWIWMSYITYYSCFSSQLSHLYHHLSLFWEAWLHAKYRTKTNFTRCHIWFEAFTRNKCAKIFSRNQLCQCLVENKNKRQNPRNKQFPSLATLSTDTPSTNRFLYKLNQDLIEYKRYQQYKFVCAKVRSAMPFGGQSHDYFHSFLLGTSFGHPN